MNTQCLWLALILAACAGQVARSGEESSAVGDQVDAAVDAVIKGGRAPASDDATFLRRVWLDLAGRTPPIPVVREFLDDKDPSKRAKIVDNLLDSEEFADHWGRVLAVWLTSERPIARDGYDGRVLHGYLRESLVKKLAYNQIIRDLLTGTGVSDTSGPANFYLRYDVDPSRLAGAVGKNLLGVTIQCAQCHDHPFAPWKQDQFWGLSAVFARVKRLEGDDNLKAIIDARRGELRRPDPDTPDTPVVVANANGNAEGKEPEKPEPREVVVKPRLLNGKPASEGNRRDLLADWVVARDNPLFARNLVNRVWEQLVGKAPLANLDSPTPKPEPLTVLKPLADDFVKNGHDLRRLIRVVVLSKTYGQTASSTPAEPPWARPKVRQMSVDQLHASIAQATGHDGLPDEEDEEDEPDDQEDKVAETEDEADEPADEDANVPDIASDALGPQALTLQRALVLINGEFIREATRSAARVARATQGRTSDAARIELACLATLGRRPTDKESAILRALLPEPNGLEDVYWVLLNASEFQVIR